MHANEWGDSLGPPRKFDIRTVSYIICATRSLDVRSEKNERNGGGAGGANRPAYAGRIEEISGDVLETRDDPFAVSRKAVNPGPH